jgi:hypothetical protein
LYNRPEVAAVPSGLSPTPLRKKREGHRIFENRVLKRIFGTQKDKIIGDWRKQHNEE